MQAAKQKPTEADKIRTRVVERTRAGLTTATAERLVQAGSDGFEHTETNVQRIIAAPLDRLWKAGFITRQEFEAADRYRADAYLAAIDPAAGSVNWDQAGGGGRSAKVPSMFNSQVIFDARRRWRDIDGKVSGTVALVLRLALIKETTLPEIGRAVFGRGDPREATVAGQTAVRVACGALVDAYRT